MEDRINAAWAELYRQADLNEPNTPHVDRDADMVDGYVDMGALVAAILRPSQETQDRIVTACRSLQGRRVYIDDLIAGVDRKRSWRPSEKAMAVAAYKVEQNSIDMALSVLKPMAGLDA